MRLLMVSESVLVSGFNCLKYIAALTGKFVENTLPALEDLIRRDNAGELPAGALAYAEFDVHVGDLLPSYTLKQCLAPIGHSDKLASSCSQHLTTSLCTSS